MPLIEKPLSGRHWFSFHIDWRELKADNHAIIINNISFCYPNNLRPMITGEIIKASDPSNKVDEPSENHGDDRDRDHDPARREPDREHHSTDQGHDERQGREDRHIDKDLPEAQILPSLTDVRGQHEPSLEWKERRHETPSRRPRA